MKRQVAALSLFLGAALLAQTPYYTDNFATIDPAKWRQNGDGGVFGNDGFRSLDANGASLISLVTPPDGTGQYEARTTLGTSYLGTAVVYLGASLDALSGPAPSGQYYAVELTDLVASQPFWNCTGNLKVMKRVNGVVTWLASTPVTVGGNYSCGAEVRGVRGAGGVILVYLGGLLRLQLTDSEIQGGLPGVGVRGGNITWAGLYPPDRTAPSPVSASSIASWPFPNSIDLQWEGASDPGGYGILRYDVYRNGVLKGSFPCCELTDAAVSPSTTYTYTFYAVDYFLNVSTGASVSVTTPAASVTDPRRTGVRPAGSYWGGAGERIDMRSGNLNFTLPLANPQGRGGWGVSFALSYNSQLWRKDAAATWKLGRDVGYGFGWRLMAGSITPYWSDPYTIHHYIFTDSTGAEYRLDVNAGGIWTTREGLYVEYDAAAKKLFFPDGSFWYMGAVSSGVEQDAGSRYPTLMQDTNGNQILVRYNQGKESAWPDSSARINQIEDVRATPDASTQIYRTYLFTYNYDSIPHLTYIRNVIGYSESYDFSYLSNQTLNSPFSPPVAFGATHYLQTVTIPTVSLTHTFEYAAGAGELTKVTFPYGGSLRWAHRQFTYTGNRTFREVQYRYLRPSSGAAELAYQFIHDDSGDAGRTVHAWTLLGDPSGAARAWFFYWSTSSPWAVGLVVGFGERPSLWATETRVQWYTWG